MADKCSIKRSVLGAMCKLGSNVKIINCVLMDGVEVQDGCHLQNSIICHNAHLQVSCPVHPKVDFHDCCGRLLRCVIQRTETNELMWRVWMLRRSE